MTHSCSHLICQESSIDDKIYETSTGTRYPINDPALSIHRNGVTTRLLRHKKSSCHDKTHGVLKKAHFKSPRSFTPELRLLELDRHLPPSPGSCVLALPRSAGRARLVEWGFEPLPLRKIFPWSNSVASLYRNSWTEFLMVGIRCLTSGS